MHRAVVFGIMRIEISCGAVKHQAEVFTLNKNFSALFVPLRWSIGVWFGNQASVCPGMGFTQGNQRFVDWDPGLSFHAQGDGCTRDCSSRHRNLQFAFRARSQTWPDSALLSVHLPTEIQFAEVGERVTILYWHMDGLLPAGERHMACFDPDRTEDMPGDVPFRFWPTPIIDQSPKSMVPGVAGVIGF